MLLRLMRLDAYSEVLPETIIRIEIAVPETALVCDGLARCACAGHTRKRDN